MLRRDCVVDAWGSLTASRAMDRTLMIQLVVLGLVLAISKLVRALSGRKKQAKQADKALVGAGTYVDFPLVSKTVLTHDTAVYRFGLSHESMVLGLPIGQHVSVRTETPDGKTVVRSYTPISLDEDARGYFELMVKSYASGTVSKRIGELKVGDSISVTGPLGPYDYKPNFKRHISMVAGGTGITPMFQLLKAISGNPKDKTRVSLIYGNASEEDILLKNEIDRIVSERPEQFSVYYLLDRVDRDDWEGGQGYVTGELMEKLFPRGSEPGTQLLLCGPPRMVSSAKRLAKELEYKRGGVPAKMTDQIFSF